MRLLRCVPVAILLAALSPGPEVRAQGILSSDCADCHADGDDEVPQVSGSHLADSVHDGFDCLDCHSTIDDLPHDDVLPAVSCAECHDDVAETYTRHGRAVVGEDEDLPGCVDCHGTHAILPPDDPGSMAHRDQLVHTCGACHGNVELAIKHDIQLREPVKLYEASVHGGSLQTEHSARCTDCHATDGSAHRIYGPGDPESSVNHFRIPDTCGQCHEEIAERYRVGIHGELAARGEVTSPVCTGCHGEHGILPPSDPRARVNPGQIAEATCAPCHESAALTEKFGLAPGERFSFVDPYHGLKSQFGDTEVANCSSCHGSHFILPRTNPESTIHPANLQRTCGQCHANISMAMASTRIHDPDADTRTGWARFFVVAYTVLIIAVIGTMLFYAVTDFLRSARSTRHMPMMRRMTGNEVLQHTLLAVSFLALVLTGFALRFSDHRIFEILFGWDGGFTVRGTVHRTAGVLLALGSAWHAAYLGTHRGREFLRDMRPGLRDLRQFLAMLAFNLGRGGERPRFGRFSFVEKGEYWALIWGTVIMLVSGLLLWFDNVAVRWIPKSALDVVLVIHFYEAVLATLAVAVWHSYATIFNPEVYPGNPAWLHGKMPVAMYEHEHPADPDPHPVVGNGDTRPPSEEERR